MDKDLMQLTPEERVEQYAIENYKNGLNCSESVLEALVREGGLEIPRELVGASVGFGGGIGLSGCTCGALSAAVLANGLRYGRKDPYEVPAAERASEIAAKYYRRYHALVKDFVEENGAAACADICAAHGEWESRERRKHCLHLIGRTARLAWRYLQLEQEEAFALPYEGNTMKTFDGRDPSTRPKT
ncbi:MAG: C-GCAxxG-C-C family protein [Veillonellaceae bacterium]|nr:C-GCAxxG-C-C family protein [Veillonellaceae bacterium]